VYVDIQMHGTDNLKVILTVYKFLFGMCTVVLIISYRRD